MSFAEVSSASGDSVAYEPLVEHLRINSIDRNEKKYTTVKWLHLGASLTFLLLIIAFAVTDVDASINPTVLDSIHCDDFCDVEVKHLGEINFRFLIPLILTIAYINHMVCFLVCYFQDDSADKWIFTVCSNPVRWTEYSLTFSLTTVIAAIIAGAMDVHLWFLLFFSTAVGMGLWLLTELLQHLERPDIWAISFRSLRRLSFWTGVIAVFTPWVLIFCFYARQVSDDTPAYVSTTVLGLCALYMAVAANGYLSKILYTYDFCTSEVVYTILSLVTKLYLAINIYAGLRK